MSNIIHGKFNFGLKGALEPYPDFCEYFKVDFTKKKIKAYRFIATNLIPTPELKIKEPYTVTYKNIEGFRNGQEDR